MTHEEIVFNVKWRDLTKLNLWERFVENSIALPWLFLSLLLAFTDHFYLAIPFSAFFFLTGLRVVHNGFHNCLGTNRWLTEATLFIYSICMMASIHAVKYHHLRHHKFCLGEEDYEGKSAGMTWYGAILYGPIHQFKIHWMIFRDADAMTKRNVAIELLGIFTCVGLAFYFNWISLIYHFGIMLFSEFMMAFFAVWLVHRDTHDHPNFARTQRARWKNQLSYNMFYHLEHHLFPAIPTIKLPELADRIDRAYPDLKKKITF